MTTKFKVKYLNQYLIEIFGNADMQQPLLTQNLSQKTKFALKKLGNEIQHEYKQVVEQLKELYAQYSEEVPATTGEDGVEIPASKKIKEEFKEQFFKESMELEEMDVEISHADLTERDFLDKSTGEVVGSTFYYNLIDVLIYEKE